MVSLKLLVLLLVYFVTFVAAWKPSSHNKPFRNLMSQALLISSFSLINPITSIAIDQPTFTEDLMSKISLAYDSMPSRVLERRLDHLEQTYFTKDDAAAAFKGVKDDTAALFKVAKDDADAAFKDLKDYNKETRTEIGVLFIVTVSLAYIDRSQMRTEMNRTRTEMVAAAKQTKDDLEKMRKETKADMEKMKNETNKQMLQTLIISTSISLLTALCVWTPESAGFKFFTSIWNAVQDALHML